MRLGLGSGQSLAGPGEIEFTLGASPDPTLRVEETFEATEFGMNLGQGHTGLVGLVILCPLVRSFCLVVAQVISLIPA